jgi:spermidine synthase
VLPWIELASAPVPGGGAPLRLKQRGTEYSIMAGPIELMNSRLSGSEEVLARLACEKIGQGAGVRILIGGLGMGFTLRAALTLLGEDAKVDVAELVPAVVDWARGPLASIFAGCLDDRRVRIHPTDVRRLMGKGQGPYDAILLDVDNGPEGLTRAVNDSLYGRGGLAKAHAALRPGGVLGVWSSSPNPAFTRSLRQSGFAVEEVPTRANGRGRGARHMIWMAIRNNVSV